MGPALVGSPAYLAQPQPVFGFSPPPPPAEVTPVALPIAFIAKGLPSLGNSYAKMLCEGTSIPMPLSP